MREVAWRKEIGMVNMWKNMHVGLMHVGLISESVERLEGRCQLQDRKTRVRFLDQTGL